MMNSSNVNANDSSAMVVAMVDSPSLTSSMGAVSSPAPIAKSVSVTSFLSDTGSFSPNQPVEFDQTMETFLENARFGRYDNVLETLNRYNGLMQTTTATDIDIGSASSSSSSSDSLKQNFDINYRGKLKRYYGWSALHLSVYFNKIDIVKLLLQQPNIDVNITNNENDTPLHKAVHTSKYELVELLLLNRANLNVKNNQGYKPIDLASDSLIKRLLKAAEKTEIFNSQKQFFDAISSSDLEKIKLLLESRHLDINCTDTFGNSGLHIAANRNQLETAILLLERGINTLIKNNNNLTALDLAKTKEMKEIIGYAPHSHCRYQGPLLKKRKFLGFKEYFVVLNKGYLIYYSNENDALNDQNRKGTYFLNNAYINDYPNTKPQNYLAYSWTINYTDGKRHTLCSLSSYKKRGKGDVNSSSRSNASKLSRKSQLTPFERKKKWIQAIKEHIKYSEIKNIESGDESQGLVPIESLQQQLNTLKKDEDKLNFLIIQIEQQLNSLSTTDLNQLSVHSNLYQAVSNYRPSFDSLKQQIQTFIENTNKCLSLHEQRDLLLKSQLAETRSKCELLEQSLRVIAQENLELETNKIKHPRNTKSPSPMSAKESMEDDLTNEAGPSSRVDSDNNSEFEEFFDIADDPLTDEENENNEASPKGKLKNTDNQSLALRSCYGSLTELNRATSPQRINNGTNEHSSFSTSSKQDDEADDKQKQNQLKLKHDTTVSKISLELDENGWRLRLPAKMIDRSQISIWSILKQFIGKELSKIAMPAALCEPLSFLQRITENAAYCNILNRASESTDPCKRLEYVCAFAVASVSSNVERLSKPFNPLLGETYELTRDDHGMRIISEQVSHHPPVSAFHADSTNPNAPWRYYGSVHPKIKFWGKSIEVQPKGLLTIEFPNYNESYTWHTVTCCVHNIIVGKLWFEYYGTMEIVCHQTGYKAVLNFKPYSWSNKDMNKVDGYIYDNKKNKVKALYGYWTKCVYSCDAQSYDSYLKSGKQLPMTQFDQNFNVTNSPTGIIKSTSTNIDLDLSHITNNSKPRFSINTTRTSNNFNNQNGEHDQLDALNDNNYDEIEKLEKDDRLGDELQRKMSLKINELRTSASLPSNLNAPIKDLVELWVTAPRPPYSSEYYNFSYFTMCLNEMKEDFRLRIAPTDSRFRTDVKCLELGDLDGASREKQRLEEKQRESRKNVLSDYKGKWFYWGKHPIINEELWLFTHKYWQRDYTDCPDLF